MAKDKIIDMSDEMIEEVPDVEREEEDEEIDDFDMEALIVSGTDADVERVVKYFDLKTKKIRKMRVNLRPVSHAVWESKARQTGKKSNKSMEQMICSKGWLYPDGMPIEIEDIRAMAKGVVTSVFEEIKEISGQTENKFEDKFIQQLSNG